MKIKIIILFLIGITSLAAETNFEKLNQLSSLYSDTLVAELKNLSIEKVYLEKQDVAGFWLLEQKLVTKFNENDISVFSKATNENTKLSLNIIQFKTEFLEHSNSDSLIRITMIKSYPVVENINGQLIDLKINEIAVSDTITYDNLESLQGTSKGFDLAEVPEQNKFYKKYIEPIIIIGSAAVAIILFFTVRST